MLSVPCLSLKIQPYIHWYKDDYEILTREHYCRLPNNSGMDSQIINSLLYLRKESSTHFAAIFLSTTKNEAPEKILNVLWSTFRFFWSKSQVKRNIISLKYELRFLFQMGKHNCALYLVFCLVLSTFQRIFMYIISFYSHNLV